MKNFLLEKLEEFNDDNFKFDPIKHRYTYDGVEYTSVTRFIQQFHKPFDQDYWSKYKAEQAGVPQEEILAKWQDLNDSANIIGTDTHQWIEDYFNQKWVPLPSNIELTHRINKFNIIYANILHKLEPIKFEVRIFSKKWNIAGMIDALFLYDNKIYILDYKTNKKFTTTNKYNEYLLPPFENYLKSHLSEYSIQLSLYSIILEEWGFEVGGAYIVYIGPGDEPASIHKIIDMREILTKYLNLNT